ncbi:MAG TPA: type II secretion system F family protein [Gammaproteobacteria bacterium]|jgi:type II secretory pathway component PulF|nr:type II secretion system F family protein [Gammaproteobacteria bacterium]
MDFTIEDAKEMAQRAGQYLRRWQFGTKKQLAFLEDFFVLIQDGIPANRAIEMMSQVTKGLTFEVAVSISQKISQGQQLADGMQDWFSPNIVEIIRVGEAGGALTQSLQSAINMLAQKGVAISSFVGAVSYPLVVISIACVVILYLKSSVFTQFALIKPMDQWPAAGQRLVALANMIETWWLAFIVTIILLVFVLRRVMLNYIGVFRPQLDRVPPFSFYRRFVAARVLETLGLLVSNGVVFRSAIKVMQHQSNPYLLSHLFEMERLLSTGKTNIADVLDTGLVGDQDLMRLRVMAEVKGFEHGLVRMGVRGTEQATATLQMISKIVGGILLAIGGVMVILIIQGVYLTGMAMGG